MKKKILLSTLLAALALCTSVGIVSAGASLSKEVSAVSDRSSAVTYSKGNAISVDRGFTHFEMGPNMSYALYFEYKLGEGENSDYVEISVQDTYSGWSNLSGALTLWKNGTANKGAVPVSLGDGWYGVSFDISAFNGDGRGKSRPIEQQHFDLVYAGAGSVKVDFTIDWATWSINKRNKVATKSQGQEFYFGFTPITLAELEDKNVYFEFKIGSGTGDKSDCSLLQNWANVSGNIRLWNTGTIAFNGVNFTSFVLADGWRGVSLPSSLFYGDGKSPTQIDHFFCGSPGFELSVDLNTIKVLSRTNNQKSYLKGAELSSTHFDVSIINFETFSFDYRILEGESIDSLVVMGTGWANNSGSFKLTENSSTKGTVVKLDDGYSRCTLRPEDLTGDGDKLNMSFFWCAASGTKASILFDFDSIKVTYKTTFKVVEGASIRLENPYGLRFRANIGKEDYDEDATYGMVIIPVDFISTYSLSEDSDFIAILDGAGVDYINLETKPSATGDDYFIQASIVNIKDANLNRKFVSIAYSFDGTKYTYAQGSARVDYARSYVDVAQALRDDNATYQALPLAQKNVVINVLEKNDELNIVNAKFYTSQLSKAEQAVEEITGIIELNRNCEDQYSKPSAYSWKVTCPSHDGFLTRDDWAWMLIDLGSVKDLTGKALSFDIKFENTWKWCALMTFDNSFTPLMDENGFDFSSTSWNHFSKNMSDFSGVKSLNNVRYVGICLNFDEYKTQTEIVYLDNLSIR